MRGISSFWRHIRHPLDRQSGTLKGRDSGPDRSPSRVFSLSRCEALEARRLFSTFTVSDALDEVDGNTSPGHMSLREALLAAQNAPGTDTINFASSLAGSTITLTLGQLPINQNVVIQGLGENQITISGGGKNRVFALSAGFTASISDLTVTNGLNFSLAPSSTDPPTGGAIYNEGNLTLTRVNVTASRSVDGGGIAQDTSIFNPPTPSLTLIDTTVQNNSGNGAGGGLYVGAGHLSITGSTIVANTAVVGAGLYFNVSTISASLINDTFSANHGEGVRISAGSATILNCTVADNFATFSAPPGTLAGGIAALNATSTTLINTLVARNSGGDISGTFVSSSHNNLIGNGSEANLVNGVNGNQVGTAANPLNPGLAASLANNGGPTQTYALLAGSSAIDAGDNSAVAGITTDQRDTGFARIKNGGKGLIVDIGAYEF